MRVFVLEDKECSIIDLYWRDAVLRPLTLPLIYCSYFEGRTAYTSIRKTFYVYTKRAYKINI